MYATQELALHEQEGTRVRFNLNQPDFATPKTTVREASVPQVTSQPTVELTRSVKVDVPYQKSVNPTLVLQPPVVRPKTADTYIPKRNIPINIDRFRTCMSSIGQDTLSHQGHARGGLEDDDEDEPDLPVDRERRDRERASVLHSTAYAHDAFGGAATSGYDHVDNEPRVIVDAPLVSTTATAGTNTIDNGDHDQMNVMGSSQHNITGVDQLAQNLSVWQSGQHDLMKQMHDNTVTMQRTTVDSMRLPSCELTIFNGEPIEYWPFICAFEENVHTATQDSGARLARLVKYCSKTVQSVIKCCSVMTSDRGYTRARQLLYERYGEPYIIVEAWLERIEKLKTAFNQKSLQILNLNELNGSRNLRYLADKLPKELCKVGLSELMACA